MIAQLLDRWKQTPAAHWLDALEARDRAIVLGLVTALITALLFLGIWSPLQGWSSNEHARYERQLALREYLRVNEAAARAAGRKEEGPGEGDGGSLLTLVANTAAASGIQLTRYQPDAGGGVSVVLQGQDFNAILGWLTAMEQQRQVRVRQMAVDAFGEPGRVNARINLI